MKHLIILYGKFGEKHNEKQQRMIDGECVCGYRDYARHFGEIIYMCPQNVDDKFSKVITSKDDLVKYLKTKPESLVWSVKHDPQKDDVLRQIYNKKVYYSCCNRDMINLNCDVSLVDTEDRISHNAKLWVKGKDKKYWVYHYKKHYDYVLCGRRNDKNESWFINQLTKEVKEKRRIVWVGGKRWAYLIDKSHHDINLLDFSSPYTVKKIFGMSKVGALLSEHPSEGFPQTFLEMTMCGLPVVYMGPKQNIYIKNCCYLKDKSTAIYNAEFLLKENPSWYDIRQYAIENYSLEKSYESILRCL